MSDIIVEVSQPDSIVVETSSPDNYDILVENMPAIEIEIAEANLGHSALSGGDTGQVLAKKSDDDYDLEWADIPIQVNADWGSISGASEILNKPIIPLAVPTGSLIFWSTNTAPTGYLICDGSAISRADYSALFAIIGITFGAGNGTTTFNLPDMKSRFAIGRNASIASHDVIGEKGGSVDHFHNFSFSGGGSTGNPTQQAIIVSYTGSGTSYQVAPYSHNHSMSFGGGGSTNNQNPIPYPSGSPLGEGADMLPPFLTLNYIIKT